MIRTILWIAVSSGRQAEDDKESLPEQKRVLEDLAQQHQWDVIDTILVPGHSRVYYNYREFAEAALEDNIPGPLRMFQHWENQDFDLFACMDGSRFGREQSIFAELVARTIDGGAQLFTVKDGYIHASNRRMYISMAGYSSASEIDELKRRRAMGMRGRAARGLKVSSKTLFGYHEIRDEKGRAIRQEPDPALRHIFDRVAQELLSGTSWNSLEKTLHERYGISNPKTGKVFSHGFFRWLLSSPTFWGHTAQHFRIHNRRFPHWAYDETLLPPEGVDLWRHTHPPIYPEPLSSAVQAEIRRRSEVVAGHATGRSTRRFSGLVICGECGAYMGLVVDNKSSYEAMRCNRRYQQDRFIQQECGQNKSIHTRRIKAFVNQLLEAMLNSANPEALFHTQPNDKELVRTQQRLAAAQEEMDRMVIGMRYISPTNPAFASFTTQIEEIGQEVQQLQLDLQQLEAQQHKQRQGGLRQNVDEIRAMTLDHFWELPEREINQRLHIMLSPYKIVVLNGEVVKLAEHHGRRARSPSRR